MIVGISGVAGSGKDTLFSLMSSRIMCKRFSLADELKKETQPWCIEHYGIDPLNCERKDKETIRPFLVFHATQKRLASEGRHWIDKINPKIKPHMETNCIAVITDIRYDDYKNDEVSWLKNELDGALVHVQMVAKDGTVVPPANTEEARNDPKLRNAAHFKVKWPMIEEKDETLREKLGSYVDELMFQIGNRHLGI
jgi:hypothetical protein